MSAELSGRIVLLRIQPYEKSYGWRGDQLSTEKDNKLALFEGRQIRRAFHEGEWCFSITDVVEVLVGGDWPRKYRNDLKKKITAEGYSEVSEKIGQLKMAAPDGKQRFTDCANTEGLFRLIQSIPSPKAEPFKRWPEGHARTLRSRPVSRSSRSGTIRNCPPGNRKS